MRKLIIALVLGLAILVASVLPAFAAGAPTSVPPDAAANGLATAADTAAGDNAPAVGSITVPAP